MDNNAGFAECLPGRFNERINRQGLIQQICQDGFPALHAKVDTMTSTSWQLLRF
jgi:hypothetical protein